MKVFFLSPLGDGLDVARRLMAERHTVKVYGEKIGDGVGRGWVDMATGVPVEWGRTSYDLLLIDDVGSYAHAERARNAGLQVIGGARKEVEDLENDRLRFVEYLRGAGLPYVPTYGPFTSWEEVWAFISKNKRPLVIKWQGQKDRSLNVVPEDYEDMVFHLSLQEETWAKPNIILQEKVSGYEVAIGGFFNGERFARPFILNYEHKRLMAGDVGPNTGEMGTVAIPVADHPLARFLQAFAPVLQGYVGYFDINFLVDGKKVWPLEATVRFGYPLTHLITALAGYRWTPLIEALLSGKDLPLKREWAVVIVLATGAFPYESERNSDIPIGRPLPGRVPEWVHLSDVKVERGLFYTAGKSGYPLVVTAKDPSLPKARALALERAKWVRMPGKKFRVDIGERVSNAPANRLVRP